MKKTSNDAVILAALIENGSIRAASRATGIPTRTIDRKLTDPDFVRRYRDAQDDFLRETVHGLHDLIGAALTAIRDILEDEDAKDADRIRAADAVLTHVDRLSGRLADREADRFGVVLEAPVNEPMDPFSAALEAFAHDIQDKYKRGDFSDLTE